MPSNEVLCALNLDDTVEVEEEESSPRGTKRSLEATSETESVAEMMAKSMGDIHALLRAQQLQINSSLASGNPNSEMLQASMECLKKQEETNMVMKSTLELINKQVAAKDEEHTTEKALLYVFDAGEDDAETIIAHDVRTGIRPYRGLDWAKRWNSLGRYANPRWETLAIPELGIIAISPVVIKNMHDRGKDLQIKMFLHTNQDVSVREGKFKKVGEGREVMHEMYEWREPETTQHLAEAVLAYAMALWRIWPEDWSGYVLLKMMTRYKYLCNAKVTAKQRVTLVSSYINAFFSLCAAAGRALQPPPKWRVAENLMLEHLDKNNLDSVQCRTGRDPYSGMGGGSSTASNNQGRQMNVQVQQGQHRQPKKQHQTQARQDGRGPQQGRDIFNMPLGQLSLREKLAVICKNYNSSEGCSVANCGFRHRCSVNIGGERLCFSQEHNAANHA